MNVARNFLLIGVLYLVVGIILGMYMGGSGDHTLTPVHAHINLLGFTLMVLFSLIYKVFSAMASNTSARVHFWAYQGGTLAMVCALFLMLGDFVPEATIGPVMPFAETAILIGVLAFGWNAYKNAR